MNYLGGKKMKLYLITTDDAEQTLCLFEKESDAQFVLENGSYFCNDLFMKEYEIEEESENKMYYFVVNEDDYVLDDNCFASKEEAVEYADDMGFDYEIHGHLLNSIYSGNDTLDENGNIVSPAEQEYLEDEESFYRLAEMMKKNNIEFVYFEPED